MISKIKFLKKILLLIVLSILSITIFIKYDYDCYHYGLGSLFIDNKLPFGYNIIYRTDYPQGFILENKYGFNITSIGRTKFRNSEYSFSKLSSYYYKKNSIIISGIDEFNKTHYYISKIKFNSKTKRQVTFVNINKNEIYSIIGQYKYVDLFAKDVTTIRFIRLLSFFFSIFFIIYTLKLLKKYKNYKKRKYLL